jgi:asparagine synthase (glutamine-hydrolysing)
VCGIAGIIDPATRDMDAVLKRMLGCMLHRGPDGEGTYVAPEHSLGLGMRRLSIIDLEGGWQPIWNEDHTICVVCNGEIYNYLELGQELRDKGHHLRTRSDTEVLVHLYEELGQRMTSRLRGMFAFCILDHRANELLLARDHFGQKPLYFANGDGRFAFASELKALLCLPWVDREWDRDAFLDYVVWLSLPAPRTHFRYIRKLPAGCCLRIPFDATQGVLKRYWSYDLTDEPDLTELDIAITDLDRALEESVSLHLRADVPIGILLSSGLDSRTVLAYARALQSNQIETFSVGFGTEDSELVAAAETARELGSHHHELELTARDFADDLDRVVTLLDEPIGDPACFAFLRVCEFARDHVKVLLSGEGSDELFAGYDGRYAGMLATMERTRRFRWLARFLPDARVHASPLRWERFLSRVHSSPGSEAVMLRVEALPGDVRAPRVLASSQLKELPARMRTLADAVFRPQRDHLSSLLALDVDWQLPESLLQKADKMSMGASIELRSPILDIEVGKVAARIPSMLKLPPGGPGKYVLRKTLERKLDEPVSRPKKGFPVPLREWFTGVLRQQVENELFAADSFISTYFDRQLLRAAWGDLISGWDGSRVFFALWLYERWRRKMLH